MSKWAIYQDLNGKIKTFCQKDPLLTFVDLSGILLGPDGKPATGIWDKDQLTSTRLVTPA